MYTKVNSRFREDGVHEPLTRLAASIFEAEAAHAEILHSPNGVMTAVFQVNVFGVYRDLVIATY